MMTANSFDSRSMLHVAGASYEIYRLDAVPGAETARLQHNIRTGGDGIQIFRQTSRTCDLDGHTLRPENAAEMIEQ
jgi:hypothetical protein